MSASSSPAGACSKNAGGPEYTGRIKDEGARDTLPSFHRVRGRAARYRVVSSDGAFEVRDYADLTLVTTAMRFDAQGNDGSFSRLFRYISGDNRQQQKVAMTTPVFMERGSATLINQTASDQNNASSSKAEVQAGQMAARDRETCVIGGVYTS